MIDKKLRTSLYNSIWGKGLFISIYSEIRNGNKHSGMESSGFDSDSKGLARLLPKCRTLRYAIEAGCSIGDEAVAYIKISSTAQFWICRGSGKSSRWVFDR